MTTDASDLLLPHVRQFTVGLALTDPPHPKVLGTGILASIDNLSGILTCCHVDQSPPSRPVESFAQN
jgi:hypothetical protein